LYKNDKGLVAEYEAHLSESLLGAVTVCQAWTTAFSGLGNFKNVSK
jgi:hypothetical protein